MKSDFVFFSGGGNVDRKLQWKAEIELRTTGMFWNCNRVPCSSDVVLSSDSKGDR